MAVLEEVGFKEQVQVEREERQRLEEKEQLLK